MNMKTKASTSIVDELRSGSEASQFYVEKIHVSIGDSTRRYLRSFYLLIITLAAHWLLHIGGIRAISIFSITIDYSSSVYWALSLIQAFLYYQALSALVFERYLQNSIHLFFRTTLPQVFKRNLDYLVFPATFSNLERMLMQNDGPGFLRQIHISFALFTTGVTIILPALLILVGLVFNYVAFLSLGENVIVNSTLGILAVLTLLRSCVLLYELVAVDFQTFFE